LRNFQGLFFFICKVYTGIYIFTYTDLEEVDCIPGVEVEHTFVGMQLDVVVLQHSFVWDNLLAVGMLVEVLQGMPAVVYCISVEVLLVAVDTQHTPLELDLIYKRTCSL
jgi:hypothetical protein